MMLRALALCAVSACPAWAASALDGEQTVRLIGRAMTAAGLPPPEMPVPARALPPCGHEPLVRPRLGDWRTVDLHCTAPGAWVRSLRTGAGVAVPATRVHAPDKARSTRPQVLGLARPLPRGARIGPDDLTLIDPGGPAPALALADRDLATGRRLRMALGVGQPLLDRHLEPLRDAEPGDRLTLQLASSGIEIAVEAEALEPARIGDRVRVRNLRSGREVSARLTARGLARVGANIP